MSPAEIPGHASWERHFFPLNRILSGTAAKLGLCLAWLLMWAVCYGPDMGFSEGGDQTCSPGATFVAHGLACSSKIGGGEVSTATGTTGTGTGTTLGAGTGAEGLARRGVTMSVGHPWLPTHTASPANSHIPM